MKKTYRDEYDPNLDQHGEPSKFFLEIPRECYQIDELTKTDILVYSTILAGLNNQMSDVFSYPNTMIAERIRVDTRQVRRSISNLQKQKLISVTRGKMNRRNIRLKDDLRINEQSGKKSVVRLYDRIFSYPLITKPMAHVYSYYLSLSGMEQYKDGCDVSCQTVSNSLGYSKKEIIQILDNMAEIGLVRIEKKGTQKCVKLLVDFSRVQPEEIWYREKQKRRKAEVEMQYSKNKQNKVGDSEDNMDDYEYTNEQLAEILIASGCEVVLKDGKIVSVRPPKRYIPDDEEESIDNMAPERYYERQEQYNKWLSELDDDDDDIPF